MTAAGEATVHVIGAGLAGLSAATELASAGHRVTVHEAAPQAGGRCRSYFDAVFGAVIDNGNHLVLSGNRAVTDYLQRLGSQDKLRRAPSAAFPFVDLATGARWTLQPNEGRVPWWLLSQQRRAPGTRARDYLGIARLLGASSSATIGDRMSTSGRVWDTVWHPILLSALNTEPAQASARLAGAIIRETLGAGGAACRPLIAHEGLDAAFIAPAARYLAARGGTVRYRERLDALAIEEGRVVALDLGDDTVTIGPADGVILAVPPTVARKLVPGLVTPDAFRSIVNAHYRFDPPPGTPAMLGVVNGLAEWIFAFDGRIAVTISGADRLAGEPREALAARIWADVARALGLQQDLPPWQIIVEKRATFAALPEQDAKRPAAAVPGIGNMALAGDWTATGLPATIEGAIRSGRSAAALMQRRA